MLGDMLELGDCTQAEHYRVGRIAAEKADFVFAYGPNSGLHYQRNHHRRYAGDPGKSLYEAGRSWSRR